MIELEGLSGSVYPRSFHPWPVDADDDDDDDDADDDDDDDDDGDDDGDYHMRTCITARFFVFDSYPVSGLDARRSRTSGACQHLY